MKVFSPIVVAVLVVDIAQAARMLKTQANSKEATQTQANSTSEEAAQARECGSCAVFGVSLGGSCEQSPAACSGCGGDWTACQLVNPPESARSYSSVYDNQRAGVGHARSMLGSGQAWSAAHNRKNEWMQIDLGAVRCVAGVVTNARGGISHTYQRVTEYKVAHSSDGNFWTVLGESFNGNYAPGDFEVQSVFQVGPQRARYIRILAQAWYSHISMRAGLLVNSGGCGSSWSDVASTDEVAVEASED